MPTIIELGLYAIYTAILLYVSWTDIQTRRIPNVVIGPAIGIALLAVVFVLPELVLLPLRIRRSRRRATEARARRLGRH